MLNKIRDSLPVFVVLSLVLLLTMFSLERKSTEQMQDIQVTISDSSYTFSSASTTGNNNASSETTLVVIIAPGGSASNPCTANFHQKVLSYSFFREKLIGKFNSKMEQQTLDIINVTNTPSSNFFVYTLRKIIV